MLPDAVALMLLLPRCLRSGAPVRYARAIVAMLLFYGCHA